MSATGDASERGATLLEAMVVLAIAGLIAGLAFPNIARGIQAQSMRHAARTLVADLALARSDSIRRGQPVTFAVAADGRAYGWTGAERRALPPDVRLSMSVQALSFDSDGRTPVAAALSLRGPAGERLLSLDPRTGRAVEGLRQEARG